MPKFQLMVSRIALALAALGTFAHSAPVPQTTATSDAVQLDTPRTDQHHNPSPAAAAAQMQDANADPSLDFPYSGPLVEPRGIDIPSPRRSFVSPYSGYTSARSGKSPSYPSSPGLSSPSSSYPSSLSTSPSYQPSPSSPSSPSSYPSYVPRPGTSGPFGRFVPRPSSSYHPGTSVPVPGPPSSSLHDSPSPYSYPSRPSLSSVYLPGSSGASPSVESLDARS